MLAASCLASAAMEQDRLLTGRHCSSLQQLLCLLTAIGLVKAVADASIQRWVSQPGSACCMFSACCLALGHEQAPACRWMPGF